MSSFKQRRVIAIAAVAAGLLAAVPLVAFVIVPRFVQSTLQEPVRSPVAVSPSATPPVATPTPSSVPSPRQLKGSLRRLDPVHFGQGTVSIQGAEGSQYLRFENVDIAGAPNMLVYLSDRNDGQPGSFTDLGPLKATNGSFNYDLPHKLDLARIHSVVVWCKAFNVAITYAEMS